MHMWTTTLNHCKFQDKVLVDKAQTANSAFTQGFFPSGKKKTLSELNIGKSLKGVI